MSPLRMAFLSAAFLTGLVGCAAPPNTPGAGQGGTYTPIVDMQGVDQTRYYNDLAACRQYANSIDIGREQTNAAIGGALFGAALMAAVGGNSRQIGQTANAGALGSMNRQTGRTLTRQESVLGNCLASRGYRVLDGTAQVSFVQQVPSQPAAPSIAPLAAPVMPQQGPQMQGMPPGIVQLPTPAGNPPQPKEVGRDAYVAERVARDAKCNATGLAVLVAKGAGYESYSMQCTNGDAMMIRCEFGNCRALR